MKKSIFYLRFCMIFVMLFMFCSDIFADSTGIETALSAVQGDVVSYFPIVRIISNAACGIMGLVAAASIAHKFYNGEQDSTKGLMLFLAGLIIFSAIVNLVLPTVLDLGD